VVAVPWVRPEGFLKGVDVLDTALSAESRQWHVADQLNQLAEDLAVLALGAVGPRREAGRAKVFFDQIVEGNYGCGTDGSDLHQRSGGLVVAELSNTDHPGDMTNVSLAVAVDADAAISPASPESSRSRNVNVSTNQIRRSRSGIGLDLAHFSNCPTPQKTTANG
jgi:hypothetical protein